jgi:ABC-type transport system involved in multi-copper enzyme maturation permease subunit
MKVWAVALNTFKETIRDRILYNLLVFALFMIILTIALGELTIGEEIKVTTDLGLSCISIFGTLIAIFLGIGLVGKEIERKTIYSLVAKPLPRYQFLLGKFAGLFLTILVNLGIMTLAYAGVLSYMAGSFTWPLGQAILLILVELAIIIAAALLFSTFTSPTLSAIFSLAFFVIGRMSSDLRFLGGKSKSFWFQHFSQVLYYCLPNLSNYSQLHSAAAGGAMDLGLFFQIVAIGVLTAALILGLAMLIFQRRDFT